MHLQSDWTCYSVAPISLLTKEAFGNIDPEQLVVVFLGANAVASACEPIILSRLGLRRTVLFGALLLMIGSVIKSGGMPPIIAAELEKGQGEWRVYLGFFLVGLSQPLYQCTPALLSASWFPERERTMATGVALNANQLGIGFAFIFGTLLVAKSDDIPKYFGLLSIISTITFLGALFQFDDAPPTPPSDTARVIRGTLEVRLPSIRDIVDSVRTFGSNRSFTDEDKKNLRTNSGSLHAISESGGDADPGGDNGFHGLRPSPAHWGRVGFDSKTYPAPSPMMPGPTDDEDGEDEHDAEQSGYPSYADTAGVPQNPYMQPGFPGYPMVPPPGVGMPTGEGGVLGYPGYPMVPPGMPAVEGGSSGGYPGYPMVPPGVGMPAGEGGAPYYPYGYSPYAPYYDPRFNPYFAYYMQQQGQQQHPQYQMPPHHMPPIQPPQPDAFYYSYQSVPPPLHTQGYESAGRVLPVPDSIDEGAEPVLTLTPHHLDIDIRDDQVLLSIRACLARPGFIHSLVAFTVSGIVINTLSTFMDFLVRLNGAGREMTGIVGGSFQFMIMVSSLTIGSLTDKTRAYYSVIIGMLVLGAFGLAECGVSLDADRGTELRWALVIVAILVGPLQPVSTELGVEVVYPLSENTVLVIQQLFSNLLSALFIPCFKAMKDMGASRLKDGVVEKPEYTFSFYLLIVLHAAATVFFGTFSGRYLRYEHELSKKTQEEERKHREQARAFHPLQPHDHFNGDYDRSQENEAVSETTALL